MTRPSTPTPRIRPVTFPTGRIRLTALLLLLCTGAQAALASNYDDRYALQVAGTLDIHWECISGPPGAPVGCTGIEFTDGTLVDAADGSVTMSGISTSQPGCIGLDNYSLTMAPDGLSLSGFASAVPMTLTRLPGEAAFVGDWVDSGYVFRATIAADPFPIPGYDPSWLGTWVGGWTDANDPLFLGSVEMTVEQVQENGSASVLSGTLTWDCLFWDECGAVQQFDADETGGFAELIATNQSGVENFTDGQYEFTRSPDGLSLIGVRLDNPPGTDIQITMHRVTSIAVPAESPSIQQAVDDFASRPTALRIEVAPGTYAENVKLTAFAPRQARSDVVGMGALASETVIDDGVVGNNATILETDGAGSNGLLVLQNLTVTGGSTVDSGGAGLVVSRGDMAVVVRSCELRGNTTVFSIFPDYSDLSGANATLEPTSRARFESTTMANGYAAPWGGGLLVNEAHAVVVDCDIESNSASDGGGVTIVTGRGDFLRTRIVGNNGFSTGGGFFNTIGGHITIEDCEFLDNVTQGSFNFGGAINSVDPSTFTIRGTRFARNVAGRSGGAVNFSGRGDHLVENCVFGGVFGDGNTAGEAGGGIVIRAAKTPALNVTVANSTFSYNGSQAGGGIAVYTVSNPNGGSANVELTGNTFLANTAAISGGGVDVRRVSHDVGSLVLDGCDFYGNVAGVGGGLGVLGTIQPVQVTGGTFEANEARQSTSGGGGIYAQDQAILMSGVQLFSNSAGFGGGALLVNTAASSLDHCVFGIGTRGNFSISSGGGLYVQPAIDPAAKRATTRLVGTLPVTLEPALPGFDADETVIAARRAMGDPITISDTVFEGNSSYFGGGMIHVGALTESGNLNLERVQFLDNAATYGGGAYILGYDDECIATSVEFRRNTAVARGGGMEIESGTATIANGLFFENVVTNDGTGVTGPFGGGALSVSASDTTYTGAATLVHTSVVANRVEGVDAPNVGGGGLLVSGDATVWNSILYSNQSPTPNVEKWQIEVDPTALAPTADVRSSIVEGWDALSSMLAPGPIFDEDPAFLDLALGDLHLGLSSFAINAGDLSLVPTGLYFDLDGNPRVIDTGVDLGAYESGVVTAVGDGPSTVLASRLALYPNPFNPALTISFSLEHEQDVCVSVYDLRGRRVRVLEQGRMGAGSHELRWDGTDAAGRQAASGNYLVELRTGERRELRSAVLVK